MKFLLKNRRKIAWTVLLGIFGIACVATLFAVAPNFSMGADGTGGRFCFNRQCISDLPTKLMAVFDLNDRDEDLVPSVDDKCPDKKDETPDIQKRFDHEGCPDTDADTVFDNIDKCPNSPTDATHKESVSGCLVPNENDIYFAFDSESEGPTSKEVEENENFSIHWNVSIPHLNEKGGGDEGKYEVYIPWGSVYLAYERPLKDSKEWSFGSGTATFPIHVKVGGVMKEIKKSVTVSVHKVDGVWSDSGACSAKCGIGRQRKTCSAPKGGGEWCTLEAGAQGIGQKKSDGGWGEEEIDCTATYFDRKDQVNKPLLCVAQRNNLGCKRDNEWSRKNEDGCNSGSKDGPPDNICLQKNETYRCPHDTHTRLPACFLGWTNVTEFSCVKPNLQDAVLTQFPKCPTPDSCKGGVVKRSCLRDPQWGGKTCEEVAAESGGYSKDCPIASECSSPISGAEVYFKILKITHIASGQSYYGDYGTSLIGEVVTKGGFAESVRLVGDFGTSYELKQFGPDRRKWRLPYYYENSGYWRGKNELVECEKISNYGNTLERFYKGDTSKPYLDQEYTVEIKNAQGTFPMPIGRIYRIDWKSDTYRPNIEDRNITQTTYCLGNTDRRGKETVTITGWKGIESQPQSTYYDVTEMRDCRKLHVSTWTPEDDKAEKCSP